MRYTKGRAGPVSTHDIAVSQFRTDGPPSNPIFKAIVTVKLREGQRSVRLIAQGRKAQELAQMMAERRELRAELRWTGREAATVIAISS